MDTPDEPSLEARTDPFRPPDDPCECFCLHCQRPINSADMWYQPVVNGPPGSSGFWMCPTPNCGGAGFTFDIFPVDPDHPANEGWHHDDSDEDDDDDNADEVDPDAEYDPDEPQYADELAGPDDDDEGEEWKLGLQPGEPRPESPEQTAARERFEAQQRKYDEPDRRPRTVDGSHWKGRQSPPIQFNDDEGADPPF